MYVVRAQGGPSRFPGFSSYVLARASLFGREIEIQMRPRGYSNSGFGNPFFAYTARRGPRSCLRASCSPCARIARSLLSLRLFSVFFSFFLSTASLSHLPRYVAFLLARSAQQLRIDVYLPARCSDRFSCSVSRYA